MGDSAKIGNSGTGFGDKSYSPMTAVDTAQYGDAMDWKGIAAKMDAAASSMQGKSAGGSLLKAGQVPSVASGGMMPMQEMPNSGGIDSAALEKLIRLISRGK